MVAMTDSIKEDLLNEIDECIQNIVIEMDNYLKQPETYRTVANELFEQDLIMPYLISQKRQAWCSFQQESYHLIYDRGSDAIDSFFFRNYDELMANTARMRELVCNTLSDYQDSIHYFFYPVFQATMSDLFIQATETEEWINVERTKDQLIHAEEEGMRAVFIGWLKQHSDLLEEFMIYQVNWFRCFGSYNTLNFAYYLRDMGFRAKNQRMEFLQKEFG